MSEENKTEITPETSLETNPETKSEEAKTETKADSTKTDSTMADSAKADSAKPKKGRKRLFIVLLVLALLAVAAGLVWFFLLKDKTGADEIAYDETSYTGAAVNYYSGVVIAEDTWNITKDNERTIDKVNVKAGDEVHTGDVLFTYSTADTAVKIESAQVSIEGLQNTLTDYNNQIAVIERQKSKTKDEDEILNYEAQISKINVSIRQTELEIKTKQVELNDLQAKMDSSQVVSTMDGIVQTVSGQTYYMTILGTGKFKVKGTVDELTVSMLSEGQKVYVHSRVNDDVWTGTIAKIDTDKAEDSSNSSSISGESGESATKYSFTIELDDASGLMLGQHVYIETAEAAE